MSKKILIVDDDPSILDATSLILQDSGYTVRAITKGEEVYGEVEKFKPDLIILDVLMSGKDGRQICKNLKSDKKTQEIPIIMISAHPSAREGAIKFGANEFLAKPFEIDQLLTTIEKYI